MKTVSEHDARTVALAFVRELSLSLTPEAENELATQVHQGLRLDQDNRAIVVDSAGHPIVTVGNDGAVVDLSPKDFVAQAAARLGARPKTASKHQPLATGGMNVTARMKAAIEGRRANQKAQAAAEAAKGNPWKTGHINRSRQGLLQNLDPELAARMKQEAGR